MSDRQVYAAAYVTDAGKVVFDEPMLVSARLLRIFRKRRIGVWFKDEAQEPSDALRGYYFRVVVRAFMGYTGYEKDEAHRELRRMFLTVEEKNVKTGKTGLRVKSTTELDDKQYSEYVNECIRFLNLEGVRVPEPNEPETEVL